MQSRDGDIYTTEMSYNVNPAQSNYSYGNPVETKVSTSAGSYSEPRVTQTTYEHKDDIWVLGLPKTVTQNGLLLQSNDYDEDGQRETLNRFGEVTHYEYNKTGTIAGTLKEIRDSIGRITELRSWKRGTPQYIKQAVGTDDEINTRQWVDDNGWLYR